MKIWYEVMGEPFVTGADHEIITWSAEFVVVTVDGGSAIYAHSIVIVVE